MKIIIRPNLFLCIMLIITAGFTILYIAGFLLKFYYNIHYINGLYRLFNLDGEANIPQYFQSLGLLFCGLLLFSITTAFRGRDRLLWQILAFVFIFLSVDEACMIHEMLIGTVRRSLNLSGLLYNAWVIPYGIALILAAFYYIPFLARLPRKFMLLFIFSAVLYMGGSLLIEMFQGSFESVHGNQNIPYCISVAIEESMEIAGISMFAFSLLSYMVVSNVRISLSVADE